MDFNIHEIERILNNVNSKDSSDFEVWSQTLSMWRTQFIKSGAVSGLAESEYYSKMSAFEKCEDYSEENFKRWFPTSQYDKYLDPNTLHEQKRLKATKVQKIAFELTSYIPLSYEILFELLFKFYMFEKKYTYEALTTRVSDYDSDLCLRMTVHKAFVDVQREKNLKLAS